MSDLKKPRRYTMHNGRSVPLAVAMAEEALGKPLPPGAVVHHADGQHWNDRKSNLVICPSKAYHNLLHARIDAMAACGNPNWMKCSICKEYDDPAHMYLWPHERKAVHRLCHSEKQNKRYHDRKRNV